MLPDGTYKHYDKRHLFELGKEHDTYTAGKERLIVNLKGWKICPVICYDLRFPVFLRNKDTAYDMLLVVANWPEKTCLALAHPNSRTGGRKSKLCNWRKPCWTRWQRSLSFRRFHLY